MRQLRHSDVSEITLTGVLSALGDNVRLRIVRILADGLEHPRQDFEFDLAQSTISHHMKLLREAGVVHARVEGTRCYASLRTDVSELFPGLLENVLSAQERPGVLAQP